MFSYEDYAYKAYAKQLQRYLKHYLLGKIFVEPFPEKDRVLVTIENGDVQFGVKIDNIGEAIKADEVDEIGMRVRQAYKDHIWHTFFRDLRKGNRDANRSNNGSDIAESVESTETAGEGSLEEITTN